MTDSQQNPQDRLKAVRQIGLSAISAIDRARKEVREGRADRTLSAISNANAERVQDAELAALLSRDDLTPFDKLNSIAQRTAVLSAEIEGPLLPPGWMVTESISARNYQLQGGGANVSVTKDSSDRGAMNIKVHGYNTWSGYEGDTTGYVPLAEALQRAQETLIDPSKHLSPYGVAKVAEAKNKIDEIENTREQSLAAFRQEMTGWQATADRYKNALLGERNILLDKHERAFSLVQVDGVTRSKLELPRDASLTGVAFMNAATAEKARVEMEAEMPEFSPFVVWDFKDYALSKVDEAKRIMDLLVNDKWSQPGRESKTLSDAKELATLVIEKAGLTVGEWRKADAITPWEFTDVAVGDTAKVTVGVSSGGVVSIDGRPFSPENREMNVKRGPVEDSLYTRVAELRRGFELDDGRAGIVKRLAEQGYRMEFDAGAIPGEGHALIRVANGEAVDADDNVPDGVLSLAREWSDLADKASQSNEVGDGNNMAQKYGKMDAAQRTFVDQVVKEGGGNITHDVAVGVANELGELAVKHLKLAHMELSDGLSPDQSSAQGAIEQEIRDIASKLPGVKSAAFLADPRGTTVGLKFESGAYDSFGDGGMWKVPVAKGAIQKLDAEFWRAHVPDDSDMNQVHAGNARLDPIAVKIFANKGIALGAVPERDFAWTCDSYQKNGPDRKDIEVRIHVGNYMGQIVHREMKKDVHYEDSPKVAQGVLDTYKSRLAEQSRTMTVEMRSKTTFGTDSSEVRVWNGQSVRDEANRVAEGYGAEVTGIKNTDGTEYQDDGENVIFRSAESDVYVAQMPNGHLAITDGYSTDYVNIRSKGNWARESDQLQIGQDIRDFLSSVDSKTAAVKAQEKSGVLVLTIDNTDNAAFVDVGRDFEIASIIKGAANIIAGCDFLENIGFDLRDTNGNRVGSVKYLESAPTGRPEEGRVRLSVKTGNSAFSENGSSEMVRILQEAAAKASEGDHSFALRDLNGNTVGKYEYRELPSLAKDGVIDMAEALDLGRVFLADDGYMGIADGEYRYVVTTPEFTPGYRQGEGDVWLVNAKGEIADGYETPQRVREVNITDLKTDQKSDLRAVAEGRVSFEDFERRIVGDEPELG